MKTILVVDDEPELTQAIELLLSTKYRVLKASTGEEALMAMKDYGPDLVLLDIMMPGFGGLETLKVLRSHPDFKNIPVIVMSGAHPLARQTDYGWSDFINKPFAFETLLTAINKIL
jgi:two-component system alkaline phosphatase synthesis response regulator PhoP